MPRRNLTKAERRERAKKIISLYYDHNVPQHLIARRFGVSRALVYQILRDVRKNHK